MTAPALTINQPGPFEGLAIHSDCETFTYGYSLDGKTMVVCGTVTAAYMTELSAVEQGEFSQRIINFCNMRKQTDEDSRRSVEPFRPVSV